MHEKKKKEHVKHIIVGLDSEAIKNINIKKGFFRAVLRPWPLRPNAPDFSVKEFRQIFSDEKARILHTLKIKEPDSLYGLAKLLKRDFKAVRQDIRLLEDFGFIRLVPNKLKNKKRLKPVLDCDKLQISVEI